MQQQVMYISESQLNDNQLLNYSNGIFWKRRAVDFLTVYKY